MEAVEEGKGLRVGSSLKVYSLLSLRSVAIHPPGHGVTSDGETVVLVQCIC